MESMASNYGFHGNRQDLPRTTKPTGAGPGGGSPAEASRLVQHPDGRRDKDRRRVDTGREPAAGDRDGDVAERDRDVDDPVRVRQWQQPARATSDEQS